MGGAGTIFLLCFLGVGCSSRSPVQCLEYVGEFAGESINIQRIVHHPGTAGLFGGTCGGLVAFSHFCGWALC